MDGPQPPPLPRGARGVANIVSATPRVGRSQRPRLHHASSCAGTRRARLGLRGRSGAPTTAPPTVAALTPAQMKIPIYEEARPQGTRGLRPDDSCRNACSPQASHGAPGGRPSASLSTHEQASPLPLSRLPDRTSGSSTCSAVPHACLRQRMRESAFAPQRSRRSSIPMVLSAHTGTTAPQAKVECAA